jgi:hypothetical protein
MRKHPTNAQAATILPSPEPQIPEVIGKYTQAGLLARCQLNRLHWPSSHDRVTVTAASLPIAQKAAYSCGYSSG